MKRTLPQMQYSRLLKVFNKFHASLNLFNLSCQLLKEFFLNNDSCSVAGLQAGIYLVEKEGNKAVKKLVLK